MQSFVYRLEDEMGLHARPAVKISMAAAGFPCEITLTYRNEIADAKEVLEVMCLSARKGADICFTFSGEREEEACKAIKQVLAKLF